MRSPEEDLGFHGTGVTDGCEMLRGCWELNPGLQCSQLLSHFSSPSAEYFKELGGRGASGSPFPHPLERCNAR